jgi:hypothetical protein
MAAVPTADTVKHMLELGSMEPLGLSTYPLEEGPFIRIRWEEQRFPSGDTLLDISSQLVDGNGDPFGVQDSVERPTIFVLRKNAELLTRAR